jgi:molybdenum cofactor synthesis domain-containing protein
MLMTLSANSFVTAAIVVIGNEILSGRTKEANLAYLAERLNDIGVRLMEGRIVGDLDDAIIRAVNECRAAYDYVFTTGGIGPTHDDITAAAIAKAFDMPLTLHPEAVGRLQRHYPPGQLNEARLRMALTPEGATLIDNPISAAPGFQVANVFVMAGVPVIMQAMFEGIRHRLVGGAPLRSRTFRTNLAEGTMAADLGALQGRYPDVEIGSYPSFARREVGVRIVLRSTHPERLADACREFVAMVMALGGQTDEVDVADR